MDLVVPFQVLMNMKHWIVVDLNLLWVVVMMVKELELHQIWAFSNYNPVPKFMLSLETVSQSEGYVSVKPLTIMDITTRPESSKVALPGRRFPAVELASAKPVAANGTSQTSSNTNKNKENIHSQLATTASSSFLNGTGGFWEKRIGGRGGIRLKIPKNVKYNQHNNELLDTWIQATTNDLSPSASKQLQLTKKGTVFKSGTYSEFKKWREKKRRKPLESSSSPTLFKWATSVTLFANKTKPGFVGNVKKINVPRNVKHTQPNHELLQNWIQTTTNDLSPSASKQLQLTKKGTVFKSGTYSEFKKWREKRRKELAARPPSPQPKKKLKPWGSKKNKVVPEEEEEEYQEDQKMTAAQDSGEEEDQKMTVSQSIKIRYVDNILHKNQIQLSYPGLSSCYQELLEFSSKEGYQNIHVNEMVNKIESRTKDQRQRKREYSLYLRQVFWQSKHLDLNVWYKISEPFDQKKNDTIVTVLLERLGFFKN